MDKSPDAFRTISEVAEDLDLPQHVLRFWETRFTQIRPLKRGGGRRYYRPDDVDLLRGIRHLLYGQGYTIRGVQRILKEQGVRSVQAYGRGEIVAPSPPRDAVGSREEDAAAAAAFERTGFDEEPALPLEVPSAERPSGYGLSEAEIGRLEAALADLVECRRILQGLRGTAGIEDEAA
ncbi:MerR family transcriptional regulator [Alsobacter sp. R-9]